MSARCRHRLGLTLAALLTVMLAVAINAPNYPQRGYRSLLLQLNEFSAGVQAGSIAQILGGAIGAIMLLCRSPASPAATCGCVGT